MDTMGWLYLLTEDSNAIVCKDGGIQGILALPGAQGCMCTVIQYDTL
jgi:hypothetical protein